MISLSRLRKSFVYASRGLSRVYHEEQNFRIELAVGIIVMLAGFMLGVKTWEMAILALTIGFVLLMEIVNSFIEIMSDLLKPKLNVYVRGIKDVGAAAVLMASLVSIAVAFFIFRPYL